MTCGIYAIVCDRTWRSYVGQSVNCEVRELRHLTALRNKYHHNKELQLDFEQYGESAFHFEIIEELPPELASNREAYWISFGENLYNKSNPITKILLTEKDRKRLWKNIKIANNDECWEWTGCKSDKGYGNFTFRKDNQSRNIKSHRAVYFDENKDINQDCIIRHICNNRGCNNPNHLIHGTFQDNARDILNSKCKKQKLDWNCVKLIRQKILECPDIQPAELSDWLYNTVGIRVNKQHTTKVGYNEVWVDKNYIPPKRNFQPFDAAKLIEVRQYIADGIPYPEIVKIFKTKYGIKTTPTTLCNIKKNKIYKGDLS